MTEAFEKTVIINADAASIWKHITEPGLMLQWMGDPSMELAVHTSWEVNSPILITGFHHAKFENKGTVLRFEPYRILQYSHLSSVSRLEDIPANYTIMEFTLAPANQQTALTVKINGFPTTTIYQHLAFYWRSVMEIIKKTVEKTAAL